MRGAPPASAPMAGIARLPFLFFIIFNFNFVRRQDGALDLADAQHMCMLLHGNNFDFLSFLTQFQLLH